MVGGDGDGGEGAWHSGLKFRKDCLEMLLVELQYENMFRAGLVKTTGKLIPLRGTS